MSDKAKQLVLIFVGGGMITGIIMFQVRRARPSTPVVPAETASIAATGPASAAEAAPPVASLPAGALPTAGLPTMPAQGPETAPIEATGIPAG